MTSKIILFVSVSLLFLSEVEGNSWTLEPLIHIPAAEVIKTVGITTPSTGASAKIDSALLKEFLSRGVNLKISVFGQLASQHPEIWNSMDEDTKLFRGMITARGVIVTKDYSLFRWHFQTPQILQISNYEMTKATLLYLENPSNPLTIRDMSFPTYLNSIREESKIRQAEEIERVEEEQREERRTGIPAGLNPHPSKKGERTSKR